MSVWATSWAWEQPVEGAGAKIVLVALADFADEDGECWPGQDRLATMTSQSVRSIVNHLEKLEAEGWIKRERQTEENGRRSTNVYVLQAPLERLRAPTRRTKTVRGGDDPSAKPADGAADGAVSPCAEAASGDDTVPGAEAAHGPCANESTGHVQPTTAHIDEPSDEPSKNIYPDATRPPGFDEFYRAYPRMDGDPRTDAQQAWARRIKAGDKPDQLIAAARKMAGVHKTESWRKAPHAATWLTKERWKDWTPEAAIPPAPPPVSAPELIGSAADLHWRGSWDAIKARIGGAAFGSWIMRLQLIGQDGDTLVFVTGAFCKQEIERNLGVALRQGLGRPYRIEIGAPRT